ncbi:MAG: thymidine phosphorylase, partial [Microvirga sp.]|nr:thymidine phosphorylase [Microvirga sp.]
LGKLAANIDEARAKIEHAISSGKAAEVFQRMVSALGGPADFLENREKHLQAAPIVRSVHADRSGIVQSIATRDVGVAVVALGGGRTRPQDLIDHAVGLTQLAAIGKTVDASRPLAIVHARSEDAAEAAVRAVRNAYVIGDAKVASGPSILERIGAAA